jgi:hypothetical protein
MVAPQKYRSVFTGQEIDEAIASMQGSLNAGLIANDFNGGVGRIASAELAKTLKNTIDANNTGVNIKTLLLSVPNTKVLTDAEHTRLNFLTSTTSFRGSYPSAAVRDAALEDESASYVGGELTFLVDDGSGDELSEISRWDPGSNSWKKVQLYNAAGASPQLIAAESAVDMFTYRTVRYSALKVLIAAHNIGQTQRQVQEALLTHVGSDTYISVYNEIGNVSNLFNITSSINTSTGIVTVTVNTLAANVTLTGSVLAMI